MKKVLLYSGGMDSYLISKLWKPDVKLYVDLKSRYSKQERNNLPKDVEVVELDLGRWEREDAIIPLRNLYLVMVATNYGDEICLGATAGDRVLDKSYEFANKASDLLTYLYSPQHWTSGRTIKINLDFKNMTKEQLLRMYIERGGDINTAWKESYSCYAGREEPCFCCKACVRKSAAFFANGFKDFSQVQIHRLANSLEPIVELINKGCYGRGKEEEGLLKDFYHFLCEQKL